MTTARVYLIGAGGHARCVVEALEAAGSSIEAYAAKEPSDWLDKPRCLEEEIPAQADVAFGIGGVTPLQLEARFGLLRPDWRMPSICHSRSIVSAASHIHDGAQVMAGAVVQPNAMIGRLAIINTNAVVDHDAKIGEGAHIAPGAIVLGGASVGKFAMVGAGAVILPFTSVPEKSTVNALSIWRGSPSENKS